MDKEKDFFKESDEFFKENKKTNEVDLFKCSAMNDPNTLSGFATVCLLLQRSH